MTRLTAFAVFPTSSSVPISTSQNILLSLSLYRRTPNRLMIDNIHRNLSHPSSLSLFTPLDANINIASQSDVSVGSSVVYEAVMPSTTTLIGYGLIVVLCILGSWVWANQVVPTSRAKLALSKNRGEVREYLDELRADPIVNTQSELQDDINVIIDPAVEETELSATSSPRGDADRNFERWLFTDWLQDNKSARKNGRQKEPALPILKNAKWNSGDNPVLAASALIGLGVLFTALTERVSSLM